MGDFIAYLQHRVENTKRTLQAINDEIQKANVKREMLMADLQGYERTLIAEMRSQGATLPQEAVQLPLKGSTNGDGAEVNKAEFARQFVRKHDTGVTPNDIYKGFKDAGIPIAKPYVYALVQRLQKQTAIRSRRGKWYPVLESDNGTGEQALP